MPFTPEEIENKEFLITLRGYDKDEVHAFLRSVAADYRAALRNTGNTPAPAGNAFEALGEEVSSVLQRARESADEVRRKADEDAAEMRQRAEEEARSLRDAATNAARRLTDEAERHALQVRASAEREASEKIRETSRRLERLQVTETKLRQRLYSLETMLQNMRQELEAADVTGQPIAAEGETAFGDARGLDDVPDEMVPAGVVTNGHGNGHIAGNLEGVTGIDDAAEPPPGEPSEG